MDIFLSFSLDSEKLPKDFDKLLPDVYNEIKNDSMRGNFLAVTGRKESDKKLISLIAKHFLKGIYNHCKCMAMMIR
jgi:hypothetical protein